MLPKLPLWPIWWPTLQHNYPEMEMEMVHLVQSQMIHQEPQSMKKVGVCAKSRDQNSVLLFVCVEAGRGNAGKAWLGRASSSCDGAVQGVNVETVASPKLIYITRRYYYLSLLIPSSVARQK